LVRTTTAGVNHAATRTASYLNIALSDPLARRGLHAFEDSELVGSAAELLAGGPHESQAGSLFAVLFSRNCTGGWLGAAASRWSIYYLSPCAGRWRGGGDAAAAGGAVQPS
jgi:hypothetical protein